MSSPALAKVRGKNRGANSHAPQRTNTLPTNMMTVLSRIKVDMPLNSSGPRSKWGKRRAGSSRYSFMSHHSQDSNASKQPFADVEEEFLHAAEFGDVPNVKKILAENADLNIDCIDALGRTALRLAVKNEHLEVVEVLLEKSNQHHIAEAVLQAISAGHTQIAETILKHRRYLEMWKERRKLGDTDGFYKTAYPDSQFSPDITPLILASQKNQYEIVQLLLLRGDTIHNPHKFSCNCTECRNKMKFDQLRLAKYRLNAYRGLASEAYISLSSKDPILTAFELASELRKLSRVEKHFKREYRDLADQLSDYVVKLLDRIRTQRELELVLNKTGRHHQEKYANLARFKLAIQFKEKKFVAHASCQQRVVRTWYNGMGKLERASWPMRLSMMSLFVMAYPFLVFAHIFFPSSKGAKVLQFPVVKFLCHAMSFLAFLLLIVVSTIESTKSVSAERTLRSQHPDEHVNYLSYRRIHNNTVYGEDFPLRANFPSVTEMMMSLWIVGMVCQECNQIFHNGVYEHMMDLYNLLDFVLLSVYIATFTLRYWVMYKFHIALDFFSDPNNINLTSVESPLENVYWMNTDRIFWSPYDPMNMQEGAFSVANILSVIRIIYLLPANESLGPLQISLVRMIKVRKWARRRPPPTRTKRSETGRVLHTAPVQNRIFWSPTDPINLLEGQFAIANILSFSRISYLLPANEILGPLQISLGRMLKDIAKFLALFILVIFAFMVGLHNLFWYYSERNNIELNLDDRPDPGEVKAEINFGGVLATFRTVFWSLFGRGEPDAVKLGGYNNTFTQDIGYVIYGTYNIAMVTVLLNMLIAMMTRSFTLIAEDSDREWKFARSMLYMDYIGSGGTLPAPLNIIGAPKALLRMIFCRCCCCSNEEPEDDDQPEEEEPSMYPPKRNRNMDLANGRDSPRMPPGKHNASERAIGGAHPVDDISAVELYETNGRVNDAFEGTPTKTTPRRAQATLVPVEVEEETLTYQQTMQRIVQRYIFDIQREAEVTEDDFEEIKQDISSFRYDLVNQMTNKAAVEEELKNNMATILGQLQAMKEEMGGGTSEKRQGKIFEKKMDSVVGKIKADVSSTSPSLSDGIDDQHAEDGAPIDPDVPHANKTELDQEQS
ncbi:hypothetical protein RRG08_030275 [Elysia crispata]|uniref:Transient receptor ion channel domain-containing protein n=1 Tax=Elysia crispata TaxID=231223 RepID=A0AAE1DY89_9GAST|nr:hypothetical protein RRG08_030275 [Elysia crispata]